MKRLSLAIVTGFVINVLVWGMLVVFLAFMFVAESPIEWVGLVFGALTMLGLGLISAGMLRDEWKDF